MGTDIYYNCSTDGGVSWGADTELSNGNGASYLSSVAVSGPVVHVVWMDTRDGATEIYYKRNPTGNDVAENEPTKLIKVEQGLKIIPNPFVSFTLAWGHEKDKFIAYNSLGKRVGVYNGNRIGGDLQPGVYFLTSSDMNGNPLRLVKIQ